MDGVKFTAPMRAVSDIKVLTREEEAQFRQAASKTNKWSVYELLLETGLRTGELVGFTWDCIDFENRTLSVKRTMEFRHSTGVWRAGPPKTRTSYRTIPLTTRAVEILRGEWERRDTRKVNRAGLLQLPYVDRQTGDTRILDMKDLVFLNKRTGLPTKNSTYDTHLYKICRTAGIKNISMHVLRHTYATRAIEAGVPPKMLQAYLGHASITMTMDRYVHATAENMRDGVAIFEAREKPKLPVESVDNSADGGAMGEPGKETQ